MVEIVGGIRGLNDCPECAEEMLKLEMLIYAQPNLIGFFSDLDYERQYVNSNFFRRAFSRVVLTCKGSFSFRELNGQIWNMELNCHE